jgi:hypothetical protein
LIIGLRHLPIVMLAIGSVMTWPSRSVLVGEHDRDNPLSHRRISWIGGMVGEGPIKIIDLEKDRLTFSLE